MPYIDKCQYEKLASMFLLALLTVFVNPGQSGQNADKVDVQRIHHEYARIAIKIYVENYVKIKKRGIKNTKFGSSFLCSLVSQKNCWRIVRNFCICKKIQFYTKPQRYSVRMAGACGNRTHRTQDHYVPLDLKSRPATRLNPLP